MTPVEYREAWAWVHLMLRGTPQTRQALLTYLRELRTNAQPGPLRPRLAAALQSPETALQQHIGAMEPARPRAAQP